MVRLGIAEAERFPELAAGIYDALFGVAERRLAGYVAEQWRLPSSAAEEISQRLIGLAAHPTLSRALLGLEPLVSDLPDRERLADDVDLDAIGRVARALLTSG
jgi:hypothetical protein